MNIIISNASDKPIYEQVKDGIKVAILTGELKDGEILPSIRKIAKELKISVITSKRAYEELEKEGLIETVRGKGSYVKKQNSERLKERKITHIENMMVDLIDECKRIGFSKDELYELIGELF